MACCSSLSSQSIITGLHARPSEGTDAWEDV
jgi:hypothetical protein